LKQKKLPSAAGAASCKMIIGQIFLLQCLISIWGGIIMLTLLLGLFFAVAEPETKAMPAVAEPDWKTWQNADPKVKQKAAEAWKVLLAYRPDRKYANSEERKQAEKKVNAAYLQLDSQAEASCAAGVEILKTSKDPWEQLMTGATIALLDGKKGEPFECWVLSKAQHVDLVFTPVFTDCWRMAEKQRLEDLPALAAVLRVHDATVMLPMHYWQIPPQECVYFVFGRFGPKSIPYLRGLLTHADPYVRRNAAIVLGYFLDEAAKPVLLKMLAAEDQGTCGAAFALGELGEQEAAPPLIKMLKNKDPEIRFWAAYALYEIGDKEALPALKKALAAETEKRARVELEAAVEHLQKEKPSAKPETSVFKKEELRKALKAALDAKGREGNKQAIAVSAGAEDLPRIEAIRRAGLNRLSDEASYQLREWTGVLKSVYRRTKMQNEKSGKS
jgi:HEAT repeat protein